MKIITDKIGLQKGGIGRRVHEMSRFVNAGSDHELIIVRMGKEAGTRIISSGRVREYVLPFRPWQDIKPGSEEGAVPGYLESGEKFREFASETVDDISEVIAKEKPDLSFVQASYYFPWCLSLASVENGIPMTQLYCGSTQSEVFDPAIKKAYLGLENYFSSFPRGTIFVSNVGRKFVEGYLGKSIDPSVVIHNGFPEGFAEQSGKAPSDVRIGWCGRDSAVKNLTHLIKLKKMLPAYPIQILTDMPLGSPERRMMEEMGFSFVPGLEPSEMWKFYSNITTVIGTSFFEFFANTLFEALSSNRVPVAPMRSGVSEILEENGLGDLVYELDDLEKAAWIINRSLTYLGRVEALQEKLKTEYSWDQVIQKYFKEFDKAH